jgi:hypothetical protein
MSTFLTTVKYPSRHSEWFYCMVIESFCIETANTRLYGTKLLMYLFDGMSGIDSTCSGFIATQDCVPGENGTRTSAINTTLAIL